MELQEIFNNLEESKKLITQYVKKDARIWGIKFYVHNYNRRRMFNIISILATLLLVTMLISKSGTKFNIPMLLFIALLTFTFFRFAVGEGLDYLKRKSLFKKTKPEILELFDEMNQLVLTLDTFTVLPPKYRTLHAVETIKNYILNERIDSLKEGINLYQDELFKSRQLYNQNFQILQNYQVTYQNSQMIQQDKKMIRAQTITNDLLTFSR